MVTALLAMVICGVLYAVLRRLSPPIEELTTVFRVAFIVTIAVFTVTVLQQLGVPVV